MAGFARKFESAKQDWTTPDDLFDPINAEFGFTLDAAADASNSRAETFFSVADDGLKQDWGQNIVWLNPPYGERAGKLSDWVKKSADAAAAGATVVMLIPARTNTNWFHDLCLKHGEVRFIRGRPKFGGADHGLPQPLCFVIFRPGESCNIIPKEKDMLKPCPFCGGEKLDGAANGDGNEWITCDDCYAEGPLARLSQGETAEHRWNTRAGDGQP